MRPAPKQTPLDAETRQHVERIVREHMGFVVKTARRFVRAHVELDDLVAEGTIGIMRALRTYDPTRGCTFLTYAMPWVVVYMQRHAGRCRQVHVPREATGRARQEIPRVSSLSLEIADGVEHLDTLASSDESPEQLAITAQLRRDVLRGLTLRERIIMRDRALSDCPVPFRQLGARLGISGTRVEQIERAVLAKVRARRKRGAA